MKKIQLLVVAVLLGAALYLVQSRRAKPTKPTLPVKPTVATKPTLEPKPVATAADDAVDESA